MPKKQSNRLAKLDDKTPTLSLWVAVSAWAATATIALIMSFQHFENKDWTTHFHPGAANKPAAIVDPEWDVSTTEDEIDGG